MSYLHEYLNVLLDPAHLGAEVTISAVFALFEFVFLRLFWYKWLKPRLTATVHAELDEAHGIDHTDPADAARHHNEGLSDHA